MARTLTKARILTLLVLLPLWPVSAGAAPPTAAQAVNAAANDALKQGPLPGLSVTVLRRGVPVYAGGFGLANVDQRVSASDATVYRINSITKAFTAIAVLQLVQRGKLRLDDRLSRYFPEYTRPGRDPTLVQLLRHTSGLTNFGGPFDRNVRLDLSPKQWVDSVNDDHLYQFAPGQDWRYSNVGYYILGLIIEKVSGEAPGAYFNRHIIGVAGMTSTRMCTAAGALPNRALSYAPTPKGWVRAESWGNYGNAAAGLCSTVVDLGRFWNALRSGRLLPPSLLKAMNTPGRLASRAPFGYGLGVRSGHLADHPLIAMTGDGEMWTSALVSSHDDHLIVIVLTNTENDRFSAAHVAVDILQRLTGRHAPDRTLPVEPRLASQIAGRWSKDRPAEIIADGGHISMKPIGAPFPPIALRSAGHGEFYFGPDSPSPGLELVFDTAHSPYSVQVFENGIFEQLELKQDN